MPKAKYVKKRCINMSNNKFTVTLQQIIDEFKLEELYLPKSAEEILISENEVNRPGLQLVNFYEYFNPERMQIVGKTEFAYLSTIEENERKDIIDKFFSKESLLKLSISINGIRLM